MRGLPARRLRATQNISHRFGLAATYREAGRAWKTLLAFWPAFLSVASDFKMGRFGYKKRRNAAARTKACLSLGLNHRYGGA
jgi:hypothetical protein